MNASFSLGACTSAVCFLLIASGAHAAAMESEILDLQAEWAQWQYGTQDKAAQDAGFAALAHHSEMLAARHPQSAEPLIWEGIALASQAQQHEDTGGIRLAEKARDVLLHALRIDPDALKGAANITLGALYAKVPGWPLGFGDAAQARHYLQTAIAANPTSVDAHYFYGDFLYQKKQYTEAAQELQSVIDAPPQPGSPLADQGRREEARMLLAKVKRRR